MPRSKGRVGRRWRRARAACLSISRVCWLCGHNGSNDVDHEPSLKKLEALGLDPCDPRFLRPAHGVLSRCPTCGRACNQEKGDRDARPTPSASRAW